MKKALAVLCALALLLASASAVAEGGWMEWLQQGYEMFSGTVENGLNTVTEAVGNGWEAAVEKVTGWAGDIEQKLAGLAASEQVQEAISSLVEAAEQGGETARSKAVEAYHTVREWMASMGGSVDEAFASMVDELAAAAGVVEAQAGSFLRSVKEKAVELGSEIPENVRNAMEELRTGAGREAGEWLENAYTVVRGWLSSQGEEKLQDLITKLDQLYLSLKGE